MKKATMYVCTPVLGFILLVQEAELAFAQITESDNDYVPGTNETSQLITSSFEVRRAVIALSVIAIVAFVGLWYYWRKTGQWARGRFVEEHGEDALPEKRAWSRNFPKFFSRANNRSLESTSESATTEEPS